MSEIMSMDIFPSSKARIGNSRLVIVCLSSDLDLSTWRDKDIYRTLSKHIFGICSTLLSFNNDFIEKKLNLEAKVDRKYIYYIISNFVKETEKFLPHVVHRVPPVTQSQMCK